MIRPFHNVLIKFVNKAEVSVPAKNVQLKRGNLHLTHGHSKRPRIYAGWYVENYDAVHDALTR